jgi:nitroimidazol reductase NimA-like FMN-containing flavoprotein (pyridoxamine 5'-phosphate oxidase superfamily)
VRRTDREITQQSEILHIIHACKVCRLALAENNRPYIVPLNYGYSFENGRLTLFFHGARDGKKMRILRANNRACFEVDCDTALIEGQTACQYGYAYKSAIGFGEVLFVEDAAEKTAALDLILAHQTGTNAAHTFPGEMLNTTSVFKLNVHEFTGKQKLPPPHG